MNTIIYVFVIVAILALIFWMIIRSIKKEWKRRDRLMARAIRKFEKEGAKIRVSIGEGYMYSETTSIAKVVESAFQQFTEPIEKWTVNKFFQDGKWLPNVTFRWFDE